MTGNETPPPYSLSLIRMEDVTHRCAMSRAMVYRLISEGKFPRQVKLSIRAARFYEHEINDWIAGRHRAE